MPLAQSAGVDPYPLLTRAGISRAWLADADVKFPAASFSRALEAVARASGWQDFGLRLAETRQISVLGPLALVVREQPTARLGLEALVRHMSLHNESIKMWIEDEGPLSMIHMELVGRGLSPLRQSIELAVGVLYRLTRQLMPEGWSARSVCFVHPPPAELRTHRRVFGRGVQFNAAFTGVVCTTEELNAPRVADPTLEQYARHYVSAVCQQPTQTVTDKVRQLVLALMPSGRCTLQEVARNLGVDVRTVRRQLAAEGMSFASVLLGLRKELALRYLETPARPLSEIAQLLGFTGLSPFSRWFSEHFGASASAWRRHHRIDPAPA